MYDISLHLKVKNGPLLEALQNFSESPYQDVCFVTGSGPVFAHKFILAASSSFLKMILKRVPPHVDACITLTDTDAGDVQHVLELLYCGSTVVPCERRSQIVELLTTLGIEFAASPSVLENIDEESGKKLKSDNLPFIIAESVEKEIQNMFNPEVRIKRLTPDEIFQWTKIDPKVYEIDSKPRRGRKRKNCHNWSNDRKRKRNEALPSLQDLTNNPVYKGPNQRAVSCPLCLQVIRGNAEKHINMTCSFLKFYEVIDDLLRCRKCDKVILADESQEHLEVCDVVIKAAEAITEDNENVSKDLSSKHDDDSGLADCLLISPLKYKTKEKASPAKAPKKFSSGGKYDSPLKRKMKSGSDECDKIFACQSCSVEFSSRLHLMFHRCEASHVQVMVPNPVKVVAQN